MVAVVAKDNWNKNAANIAPLRGSSFKGSMKKSPRAINPLFHSLLPKENANPNIQYVRPKNENLKVIISEKYYPILKIGNT